MSQTGAPLAGFCDLRLVALYVLIAILASYVAIDFAVWGTAATGRVRRVWCRRICLCLQRCFASRAGDRMLMLLSQRKWSP
jgi:hypothetical protein